MARKKKKAKKVEPKVELESPAISELVATVPEIDAKAKCDTCERLSVVMKCEKCGKTYCQQCRTPHYGHYKNCQFCGHLH